MIMFVKKIRIKLLIISSKADMRMNCSHFCIYDFPSSGERKRISSELGVEAEKSKKATKKPFSFLYVDKPRKRVKRNFTGEL